MEIEETKQLRVQLAMGCLSKTFSEQLDLLYVKYDKETMKKFDREMELLNTIKFTGLFPHSQMNKAYDKLAKKVFTHIKGK